MKKVFRIGLLGVGGKIVLTDKILSYQGYYGKTFRVPTKDIKTVTVDEHRLGKGFLKILGEGVELAKAKMPLSWANKCQDWLLENLEQ